MNYEEDIWVGYRYFDTARKQVSYPFGFGLSYTEFEYSKPKIERKKDGWKMSVVVKNVGKTAGKDEETVAPLWHSEFSGIEYYFKVIAVAGFVQFFFKNVND